MKVTEQEVFQRFAEEFGCSQILDAELLGRAFFRGSPRGEDARYMPGLPEEGVRLVGFEYLYDLPQDEEKMKCMFNSHRHRHGAAFLFSDGSVRGVGRDCFAELAEHSGQNLGFLTSFIRNMRQRRAALLSVEDFRVKILDLKQKISYEDFRRNVENHDSIHRILKRRASEFYKFCLSISGNFGKLAVQRIVDTEDGRKKITEFLEFRGWKFFHGVWSTELRLSRIIYSMDRCLNILDNKTDAYSIKEIHEISDEVRSVLESYEELSRKISLLSAILSEDVMSSYVDAWNSQSPRGRGLEISRKALLSDDGETLLSLN